MTRPEPSFYRRRLPHWQPAGSVFFITWRLFGSLPPAAIEKIRFEKQRLLSQPPRPGESFRDRALRHGKALFGMLDEELALASRSSRGPQWLCVQEIAEMVRTSLYFWNSRRYTLHRYVIMPNHVHVLLQPLPMEAVAANDERNCDGQAGKPAPQNSYLHLRTISQALKGYIARRANQMIKRSGAFWQDEGFDHWIRNEDEYSRCVYYIDENPVKAGLCRTAEEWIYGTAGEMAARR